MKNATLVVLACAPRQEVMQVTTESSLLTEACDRAFVICTAGLDQLLCLPDLLLGLSHAACYHVRGWIIDLAPLRCQLSLGSSRRICSEYWPPWREA